MSDRRTILPLHARLHNSWLATLVLVFVASSLALTMHAYRSWPEKVVWTDGFSWSRSHWMELHENDVLIRFGDGSYAPPQNPCIVRVRLSVSSYSDGSLEVVVESSAHEAQSRGPGEGYANIREISRPDLMNSWQTVVDSWTADDRNFGSSAPAEVFKDDSVSPHRFGMEYDEIVGFVDASLASGPGFYVYKRPNPTHARIRAIAIGVAACVPASLGIAALWVLIRAALGRSRLLAGQCPACGYPLQGCPRCPECGVVSEAYEQRVRVYDPLDQSATPGGGTKIDKNA